MKITNTDVYDLAKSMVASGLAMKAIYDPIEFRREVETLRSELDSSIVLTKNVKLNNPHFKRACRLGRAPSNSGHCSFLKGVKVSANFTATIKWWEQFQRYHFKEIVTSMSTMHKLREMVKLGTLIFDPKTDRRVIHSFLSNADSMTDEELVYSCPTGLLLTATVDTNYLQLKTIWEQRHTHRLEEWWGDFCPWVCKLPYFKELTGIGEEEEDGKNTL